MATVTTTASPNEEAHEASHEKPQRSFFGLIERPQQGCHPVIDWLTTVDHKKIGIMYGAIALYIYTCAIHGAMSQHVLTMRSCAGQHAPSFRGARAHLPPPLLAVDPREC